MSYQEEFIKSIAPIAVKHGKENNILSSQIISQSILESNWNRSELAVKANNLFGIKKGSDWHGDIYTIRTSEQDSNGRVFYIDADFRKFKSIDECVESLCHKLTHGTGWEAYNRYQAVIGEKDYKKATEALVKAGYATDINYARKLDDIIERYDLTRYDKEENNVVQIKQQLVSNTIASRVTSGKGNTKTYLIIHETANTAKSANAQAHANLQSNGNSRQASWQFSVDEKQIIQSFSEDYICWHAGNSSYNRQGIGIEICVNSDGDFQGAVKNAAELVKYLMRKHNIPISRVIMHRAASGKNCPANLISGVKGITWGQFINMVNGASGTSSASSASSSSTAVLKFGDKGDSVKLCQDKLTRAGYPLVVDGSFGPAMQAAVRKFQSDNGLVVDGLLGPATQKKLDEILNVKTQNKEGELTMSQYNELKNEIAKLKAQLGTSRDVSSGFTKSWDWAKQKGYLDGTRPSHLPTREQLGEVLYRFNESNNLNPTAKRELAELFDMLYKDKVFTVNHSKSAANMPEHDVLSRLISFLNRLYKDYRENK